MRAMVSTALLLGGLSTAVLGCARTPDRVAGDTAVAGNVRDMATTLAAERWCGRGRGFLPCAYELSSNDYQANAAELWQKAEDLLADATLGAPNSPVATEVERCSETGACPDLPGPQTARVKVRLVPSKDAPRAHPALVDAARPVMLAVMIHTGRIMGNSKEKLYGIDEDPANRKSRYLVVLRGATQPHLEVATWDLVQVTRRGNTNVFDVSVRNGTRYQNCHPPVAHGTTDRAESGFHGCEAKAAAMESILTARQVAAAGGEYGTFVSAGELRAKLGDLRASEFTTTAWLNCPWGCCEVAW